MNPFRGKGKPDWKTLQAQAGDVLGSDFWQEIAGMLPLSGPRLDVYETSRELVIVAELPGLSSPEEIRLTLIDRTLLLRGAIIRPYGVADDQMLMAERYFGSFERTVPLPARAVLTGLKAQYQNGLLTIRFPLELSSQEAHIPVEFT